MEDGEKSGDRSHNKADGRAAARPYRANSAVADRRYSGMRTARPDRAGRLQASL